MSIRQGRLSTLPRHAPNEALCAVHENWDIHDPWGSYLEAQFQICFALSRRGDHSEIPGSWGYRESPCGPEDADESLLGQWLDECKTRDLVAAGDVLDRLGRLIPEVDRY